MKPSKEVSDQSRSALGLQGIKPTPRQTKADVGASNEYIDNWLATLKAAACPGLVSLTASGLTETAAATVIASKPAGVADSSIPSEVAKPLVAAPTTVTGQTTAAASSSPSTPITINSGPCCGTCGYVNCPTRLMNQDQPGDSKSSSLAGQSPVSSGPDLVSGKATMGRSDSIDMSSASVTEIANWTGGNQTVNAAPTTSLPGGGETATASTGMMPGTIALMSGEVTHAVAQPQARALAAFGSTQSLAANATTAPTAINPIVLENEKPGAPESEWGLDGPASTNIEGFTTDISANVGSTISFKINTDSDDYRIDIYRLGYYGGMGATKVTSIEHTGVQNQPAPLVDPTTGEVDAGNWSVSATWNIPTDATSGVYIAKLTRLDGVEGENEIPFIVRDDSSHSDIVFQTSDETWQAYNGWGGANLYGGDGPATGQGAGRAYAVSYNRPIATRDGVGLYAGPQDYLFGAEYSAIYWLEENGYDVSYMSGVDVDRFGSLLLNHKAFVDAGHDEYWTAQQRANVQAARDAGVNLEFWSGNEMYWETQWGDSLSSDATPYRSLVTYKDTWANGPINPSGQWTGTFRDPRFGVPGSGDPENSLTGQLFDVDDVGANLGAITIPSTDADLRFWRNTDVANLQPGQTWTLTQNYLGYEWDSAVDNGFDPAGLVRLSSTTMPVNTLLLDYGNTTGPGDATHSLTLYRAPSGALVFGAGTVYWAWGLSDNHDNQPTPADPNVQQAMVNLFADMGIQPGTLQSGLITGAPSTDHTPPTSTINSITNVVAETTVTISGTAADLGGGVVAGVEVSTDNGASWHPATGDTTWTYSWSPQLAGTYTILSRAVDDSINLETPSAGRTVTVAPPPYLTVFSGAATPAVVNTTDASAVELGMRFESSVAGSVSGVRFYKSSQDTGTHTGELWTASGTLLATVTFTNETASGWQSAVFSNPVTLTPGTTYIVSYHTNVGHYSNSGDFFTTDVTSGPLTAFGSDNGVFSYSDNRAFPTQTFSGTNFWVDVMFNPSTGETPPVAVNDVGPTIAQNTGVIITAASLIANDSDVDGDGLSIVSVSAATHGTVVLNTQSNPQANTITFTPDAGYLGPASFTYTISDGRGGTATATVNLTVAPPGAVPVSLFSTTSTPAETALNDGTPLEVGLKFTSSVSGQITALKFYRSASDTGPDILDLWTSTGTKLASVTFNSSSASGWQTVNLPGAVSISANTVYVVSYHTSGAYVATTNYFSADVTNGPLTAPSAGGNGVYSYGGSNTSGIFPTGTFGNTNYWVDVVLAPTTGSSNTAPTAVADTANATEKGGVNNGTAGAPATGNVLTNDTDPDAGDTKTVTAINFGATAGALGTALTGARGTLLIDATGAFTYTVNESDPAVQSLRLSTDVTTDVFTYTMKDAAGATSSATLTVTIHGADDAPVVAAQTANQNASVGSAFSLTLAPGVFTDVDSGDSLSYVATLADGSVLPSWLTFTPSTRTFTGTPPAGGTIGIKVTATDLAGLATSETFNIAIAGAADSPPTAVTDAANAVEKGGVNNGTGGSPATGNVLTNDTDPDAGDTKTVTAVNFGTTVGTLDTALVGAHGSLVLSASGAFTYTINETDSAVQALRTSTNTITDTFTYTMRDAAGATSSAALTITIQGADDAPVVSAQTANQNTVIGSTFSLVLPAGTFTDVDTGDSLTYSATLPDGTPLPAWLNFSPTTRTFSGTPTSTGTLGIKVTATDLSGLATSETFNIVVTPVTVSLFSSTDKPAVLSDDDPGPVNLGVQFTSSADGMITGIKYYKGAGDTGTHTGSLWTSTGTLLATATFTNETASGWQTVTFSNPVAITAGTTYVASFHSNGHYTDTSNYFATAHTNGALTAPAGNNGLFAYGTGNLFPNSTFGAANYWVDVVFAPTNSSSDNPPVAVNDSGLSATQNTPLSIAASTLLSNDHDPDGDPLTITGVSGATNGTVSFNAQTNSITFTPTTGYTGAASFSYAVSDGRGGTASASVALNVNAATASTVSLFSSSPTPNMVTVDDTQSVELGFKFEATSAGDVTGLRFYKGPSNTGTHVADLWSSDGTLLATATFTNETASGWQQVNFATPVTLTPGAIYVASYHTAGDYSADPGMFASTVTNGPLTAPSSSSVGGNGVYAYGSGSLFPTNSFNSTSYGVDVLFRPQLAS
jgi:VCBS repeat-containing protein